MYAHTGLKRSLAKLVALALTASTLLTGIAAGIRADSVDGPYFGYNRRIAPNSTVSFTVQFYGRELARVAALGDGDIDIKVYDAQGRLVVKDTLADYAPVCQWTPPYRQTYTIKVINCEDYTVTYSFITN